MRWTLKTWYLLFKSHTTVNINSKWIQNVLIHFWRNNCQRTRWWHIKNSTIKYIYLFLDVAIHSKCYNVKCLFICYGVYQRTPFYLKNNIVMVCEIYWQLFKLSYTFIVVENCFCLHFYIVTNHIAFFCKTQQEKFQKCPTSNIM